VERALSARDWFLVQGPPGTGKTSIILRELVRTMVGAGERILVLAYTNRAVNEICDVLAATLPDGSFLRHGTSSGIGAHHVHHSITHIGMALTPSQLAERIRATRCIVSTIHAVHSQPEILEFGRFSTAVVDEASQVLDAHICGILAEVDRHILIGDHAQLPPVIAQPADGLSIHSPLLAQLGLSHLGTSVFERLANCCEVNGWQGALATLEHQGRMHADVMAFPSAAFYGGRLRTVLPWQTEALELPWHNLLPHRACVIEVQSVPEEARVVAVLVEEIIEAMEAAGDDYSVGVISPFRVHNRRIMDLLPESIRSRVLVDTVERFQGSQRDVIIYSTAVANRQELESIRSERHGADRKLNVASTRARHQFVMVGNAEVLKSSASYALALEMLPKLPV
jgi:DNA replication ATP-dependent helicase Dna2